MWLLGIFGPLLLISIPLALVLSIVNARRLNAMKRTVDGLTAELADLRGGRGRADQPGVVPTVAPEIPAEPVAPAPVPRPAVAPTPRPARTLDLERVLGGQWLTWVGVLALFCGSAFFLAVDLGQSPLSGLPQILIGLVVAAAFNVVGRYWSQRRERFLGLGLLGGGVALLYLAAYAAHGFHGLLPLWLVFPLLLGAATVGSFLALDRNSLMIASITLTGAFLTPVVLAGGENPTYGLLPYLVAVNLGAVLVGLRRGWSGLPVASFVANLLLLAVWWDQHFDPSSLRVFTFVCVTGSWLVFAVAPWLRRGGNEFWSALRGVLLAANGLVYALLCYNLLAGGGEDLRGVMLLVLAALYVTLSRAMQRRRGPDPATRLTFLTGVALGVIFMPVQLDLAWITLGWLALATVLLVAGLRERDVWHRVMGLCVLVLTMSKSLILDLPQLTDHGSGHSPVFNGEFLSGLALVGVLAWLVWAYHRHDDILTRREKRLRTPLLVTAVIVGLWKLSAELLDVFSWWESNHARDLGATVPLALMLMWAVAGAAVIVGGTRSRVAALRRTGDLFLGAAVVVTALMTLIEGTGLVLTYRPLINLPLLQGAGITAILGGLFWWFGRREQGAVIPSRLYGAPLLITAVLMLLLKVTFEVQAFFTLGGDPGQTGSEVKSLLTLSVVWAVYAGAVVASGFVKRYRPLRLLGITLMAMTVLKVFLVDMQALDRGYRIVAFVVLGVLLLAISMLYQRERQDQ